MACIIKFILELSIKIQSKIKVLLSIYCECKFTF